jgi:RecA-family ATPase
MASTPKEHRRIAWNTIQPKEITWLWQDRIPFGKITILVGDSGLGKTTLALDIAARLTSGRSMPLSDAKPVTGNVLFQSQEDNIDDTLLPRFISAGGDLRRIESIEADGLNIDSDCEIIERNIQDVNARIILLDPLQSFMGKHADMCRITDVRRLLSNLGSIAARNDCAILVIIYSMLQAGAVEGTEIFKACGEAGISARTVERVKKELNVRSGRDGSKRVWFLE